MPPALDQFDFPSLLFPRDRKVLTVTEVAQLWRASNQHVFNLLEEGKLAGFDISGKHKEFIRIPAAAVDALAKQFNAPRELIMRIIGATKPQGKTSRPHWRIPVESYRSFIQDNRS